MEPERQLLWKMGALPQGKNGGKPQRYKGSCKLAVQQFLVCRCGSDRAGKWNLLPENYRPEEQINLEIEDPALLLQEMLKEQEEITKELNELLKEVM